jgi:hypothetical protein
MRGIGKRQQDAGNRQINQIFFQAFENIIPLHVAVTGNLSSLLGLCCIYCLSPRISNLILKRFEMYFYKGRGLDFYLRTTSFISESHESIIATEEVVKTRKIR